VSERNGRVRRLGAAAAGAMLALTPLPSKVAAAPDSCLLCAATSPFVAAADQTSPESSRESDAWRHEQRHSRTDVERHKRGLEPGRHAPAPSGTGNSLAPILPDATLQLPNAVPQLPNAAPQLPNAVPQLPNAAPQLPRAAPALPGGAQPLPAFEPLPDRHR
jgi:hypothetical protein